MIDKVEVKVNYKGRDYNYIVDIGEYEKFVDDTLNTFDEIIRNIISQDSFGKDINVANDGEKAAVDAVLDSLRNE